jgi:large subunit ribosomal protein L24
MKTKNPGKQIKRMHNAPLHIKRKWISAHLDENLLLKYDKRAISVIKGDTVKVMRGNFYGHEDKVVKVNTKKNTIEIEGITMSKADGNKIAKPIHHSNVIITKLNLTDKWRREKLEKGLSEETKKEIEKEAQKQIVEAEEEQKRIEEQKKIEEQTKEEEVTEKEEIKEKPAKEEKTDIQKTTTKQIKPKSTKQKETKPTTQKKKKSPKTSDKKSQKKEEK